MTITVNAPLVGTGIDSDGDGFSDTFESAWGTNPNDASAVPFVIQPGGPATLAPVKLAIKLDFSRQSNDSATMSGTLPVPANFSANNQKVGVVVGDMTRVFTLNAKGRAKTATEQFMIGIKAKANPNAKFSLKISKEALAASVLNFGLVNDTVKQKAIDLPVTMVFNGAIYTTTLSAHYTAKKGKRGMTGK